MAPQWAKGYHRLGAAYYATRNYQSAIETYKRGINLDAGNQKLKEALGRFVFATGPVEHLRPMLGPLFSWSASGPRHKTTKLPLMLLLLEVLGFQSVS